MHDLSSACLIALNFCDCSIYDVLLTYYRFSYLYSGSSLYMPRSCLEFCDLELDLTSPS